MEASDDYLLLDNDLSKLSIQKKFYFQTVQKCSNLFEDIMLQVAVIFPISETIMVNVRCPSLCRVYCYFLQLFKILLIISYDNLIVLSAVRCISVFFLGFLHLYNNVPYACNVFPNCRWPAMFCSEFFLQ